MKWHHKNEEPQPLLEWLRARKAEGYVLGYQFGDSPLDPQPSPGSSVRAHATLAVWATSLGGQNATWSNVQLLRGEKTIRESPFTETYTSWDDFMRKFVLLWGYTPPKSLSKIDTLITLTERATQS